LVDSFSPSATFGGGSVAGPHDYAATAGSGGGGGGENGGMARIGSDWIALPVGILGGSLLLLLGWLGYVFVRNKRRERAADVRPLEPIIIRKRDG
jgi:hypothetical protein